MLTNINRIYPIYIGANKIWVWEIVDKKPMESFMFTSKFTKSPNKLSKTLEHKAAGY